MNNDLISREDLKTNIDKFIGYLDEDMIYRIKVVIDNAPTVKPYCYFCGQKEHGQTVERPQGEWRLHGMIYYCSECGHECGESGDNFCGNCGADMRGEKNEQRRNLLREL